MRIPYSWLREFLPEAPAPEKLEELLAGLGHETEAIDLLPAPPSGVVFAKVLFAEAIQGTDLKRLLLDSGKEVQVVSGAANAREGMGVALALPGTVLPGGLEVGVRKIQRYQSYGMALSAKELAAGEYAAGLLEFPADALPPGTPLAEAWSDETVIEIEITPNRPDMLSVFGAARDLAALGMTLGKVNPSPKTASVPLPFSAWIEAAKGCDRFTLSYAFNLCMGPSPLQAQRRLYAAGMRPINNVVDATNYAMLELGQPMHAFDLRDIGEGLVVRRALQGEKLVTLDSLERQLSPEDLLITAKKGGSTIPVGLAGVMGGENSEVRADTTAVALEVAHFNPVGIRLSARRHGLKTEASYRFERGVDPELPPLAAKRFLQLVADWAGATVAEKMVDLGSASKPASITFRPSYANRLLGLEFKAPQQLQALEALGCQVSGVVEPYAVTPPSYRMDLSIEEDLVEEVARVVGYDKLPESLPSFFPAADNVGVDAPYLAKEKLRSVFAGLGFQEVVNYSWTSPAELARLRAPAPTVALANPQASDRTHMRSALFPGLVKNLLANLAQGEEGPFLLFEIGNVFTHQEETRLAGLFSGQAVPGIWQPGLAGGYYALEGFLGSASRHLGAEFEVQKESFPHLHPGVSGVVYWNGKPVGSIGRLHPAVERELELPEVFLFELLLPLPEARRPFRDLARFPASLRDVAVVVPEHLSYQALRTLIKKHAGARLESLNVFDVYRGKPLPAGHKSLAFHLTFRHPERTLTDPETDGFMQKLVQALEQAGYAIRK